MQILKRITMLAFVFAAFAVTATAQLTGTKNVPGDYATVAAAVTDLNTQGVGAGGVTFVVADGYTETAPAGGYTITNPTGNGAGNPIVFRRATSVGTRPAFTANAALTSGSLTDAIFKIVGTDNLTIDGFQMLENALNTTTAAATNNMTEFGVALFYVTTTNGSQNVTIQNCIIDLDRTYQNTFGVYSNSTHSATVITTTASATTTDGGNSNLKLYSNSITDVNNGITVVGPTAAADLNEGLDIGGTAAATGNSITNYGTTGTFSGYANVSGTVNGILVRNTKNFNVSYNAIVSSVGGTTAGTLRGVFVPAFSVTPTGTQTNSINNNNISVRSGVLAGGLQGIIVEAGTASTTSTLNINTNDFSNTTHTIAAASGAVTLISNLAIVQNTNINSNTFTNLSMNTTGSVTFLSNSWTNAAVGGSKNVNGNSVVTAFNKTGAGGTVTWFTDNGSDVAGTTNNSNNNNFSNITVTGATTIVGLSNTNGGSPTKSVTGNTITNWTGGTSALTGMVVSFSGVATVSNNSINTLSCACTLIGLSTASGGSVAADNFSLNTIHTLSGSGTGLVTGILSSSGTLRNIFRNKIYNLENTNAGGGASGITVSGGTTINVYNNLVGDIRTPALNATNSLFGINVSGGTTVTADFNTVYLNATSTGANFGSSALNASSTPTFTMRNNVLVNLSTPAGTGVTVAYRRGSTTLSTYANASNNNDFYAGTPSATRLIFNDGTNSDQTLAAYKTRVSPRDSASVSENPNFVSTTGSSAQFLHINTATPTQLESGGIPVSGITNDFDNDTRNATTPDIGADEFAGVVLDLNPPTITYTAVGNTTSTTNRTITATITDISGVAGGANSPRIYFRKNGGSYFSTQCTGASPTYTCTIDYSLVGGVATGDVIDYFIVAQDVNGNVGANPSAGFSATSVNSITTPPTTPNTYTIVTGTPASINVGTGETYTSLTNAGGVFQALNAGVLTSNVTINITTDLTAETGAVFLNQQTEEGAGAGTYTVTIKPSGAARVISGTVAAAVIRLNGADRVTIDGSLSGGTDRSLTITNLSTATATAAIHISSLGVNAGSTNDVVKNTNLSCGADQSTSTNVTYGISQGGALLGNSGADNDNNSFINNAITKVNIGIYSSGENAANPVQNTVMSNNLIGPTAFGSDQIGRAGIIFNLTNAASVTGNEVRFVGVTDPQTSTGGSYDKFGISHAFNGWSDTTSGDLVVSNTLIARNKVHDIVEENTFSAVGIFMAGGNGANDTLNTTVNNFIWNVRADGTSGDNGVSLGIASGKGDTVAYNSIYMAGDIDPGVSATASQSSFGIQITSATVVNLNLKNNISYVDLTSNTTTLLHGAIKIPASFAWGTGGSNYNDLYVPAANTQAIVGRVGAVDGATLAAYQTASGQEANSKSVDPLFVSTTDLHLQSGSPVRTFATPIAGITTDIDGDNRNPTTPDIGADEFLSFVFPTIQFSAATYTGAEGTSATVTVNRSGDTTVASTVSYATADGTATGGASCTTGVDYVSASGTFNYAVGETSKTFNVVLCSDTVIKGSETINLALTAPTNATLGTPSTAVLTITNVNPPMPGTLQFSSSTYSVGEAGGTAALTVTRTGGSDGAVAVTYALANGTATGGAACGAGVDFVNTGGTVNFANGETSKAFNVTICNDAAFEGNETFTSSLSGATGGATIGSPSTATVTIVDDETAQPGTLAFSSATYSIGEAGGTATLTVNRTGGSDGAVAVNYALTNGTATGGAACGGSVDFVNTGGTVNFANGEITKNISVAICNDAVLEGNETFSAALSGATGGATIGSPSSATVTIIDDEVAQPGTLAFSSATYSVGESGGSATLTVSRTVGSDGAVSVNYALANGTATGGAACGAGVDFVNTGGTVNFANGETSKTILVSICDDAIFEGNETFTASLSGATGGATIGSPSTATVTITDNETQPTAQFSSATYSTTETLTELGGPGATITVTLSGASQSTVSVNYATGGGTATGGATCAAGVDYISASGTLTFTAGQTSKTFFVTTCSDTVFEGDETVNLTLSSPVGATLGSPSSAVLTIVENDPAPPGGPVTVTATAGTATATYNTLTDAAAAINAGTHQGAITVSVNQNITEPGTVVINSSGAGSAVYTSISIRPGADNITVTGASATGRGLIELNGADNVTIDGDNPTTAGTNRNMTLQNTAANTVTFTSVIRVAVAITVVTSADNNTFRNLNILGSATGRNVAAGTSTTASENTTFGIFAGPGASATDGTAAPAAVTSVSTSVAAGATATNTVVSNNNVRTAARAVSINGAATTNFPGLQITGNAIGNPTAGDADQVYAIGITAQGSADALISNNTVWVEGYVASSAAGHGINVGVNSANINGATIERNKVNRVQNNNPSTWSAFGINLGGGNNHVVQNNFVSGVINNQTAGTGAFGSTFGAYGIRIASGTGHKVYHNSVNLYGVMPGVTSTNLTAAFLMTATTQTGVDVRNNIFANQITGGNLTGTRNVSVALPSAGSATMNLTINNNAYYGSSDANSRLGQVGTTFGTGEYTYGNFDPTQTTPATNFRAYTSTLSAAGTNDNASFATTSAPPFTSNVDLHIPAGTATRLESGGAAVGVTTDIDLQTRNATTPDIGADEFTGNPPPANDIAAAAFINPTSGSTIPVGQTFTPQASFSNNGTATQTNVTVRYRITNSSNVVIYNQTATIATIAPLQVVTVSFPATSLPAAGTYTIQANAELAGDANTANDSISGTLNAVAPIGGTVNVGTGETYTSLTNAGGIFQALNTAGISGNTTINITSDLTAETGAVVLNQLAEVGAGGYTVTFKPSGAARVISGTAAASTGLITLNGADRIVFDGSLSGGTDRSLTITNNQTGTSTVIWIRSPNSSNGSNNNTFKNCIINGATGATATTTAGILTGSSVTIGGDAEAANNNNTIQNNFIYRVQNSLYLRGGATAPVFDQNWTVVGNEMGSVASTGDKNIFRGMLIGNAANFTISRNLVHGIQSTGTTTAAMSGIQLGLLLSNGSVTRNNITDIKNISASGTGAAGISVIATSTASNVTIANNFISDVATGGSATVASNGFGMSFNSTTGGSGYNVYYNSVNLNTNQTAAQTSAALFVGSTFATAGAIDLRNNILANTQTTGTRYAVYSAAPATVFSTINYNDYFAQNVGFIGGIARVTLADWQTATGQDANSKAVDPLFVSATDLHIQAASPVQNMGTPIAGVTDDYDGETRSATTPDIGADEVANVATPGSLQFSSATYSIGEAGGTQTVTVTRTGGSDGSVTVNYATGGGTATGGAACGGSVDYVSASGTLTFAAGVTSQTFNVTICNDTAFEGNETFNYTLSSPTGGATIGTPNPAVQTIVDDDPAPTQFSLAINDVKVTEADSGTTNAVFTVTLTSTGGGTFPVTVQYATANGTAIAGSDYTATSGTLTFNATGTQTITVPVIGETVKEANETFFVNLSNASPNATITDNQGVGIIVDRDRAYLADYDRDYIADFSVYRPSNSTFYVSKSTKGFPLFQTFDFTGVSVPGDYDGDGKTDYALWNPSTSYWTIIRSSDSTTLFISWGLSTDKPVQGDYTGDGKTDFAVYRPSTGIWYILPNSNQTPYGIQFGISTDRPVQADYDGDFKTDIAVYRDGIWYILNSSNGSVTYVTWGLASDKPVIGDFDGDGKNDVTVYRNGVWYVRRSLTNDVVFVSWGTTNDIPVVADYDADGVSDYVVFRESDSTWYVLKSSGAAPIGFIWGLTGDKPTPAAYLPQ